MTLHVSETERASATVLGLCSNKIFGKYRLKILLENCGLNATIIEHSYQK